jgi:uncharacterized protein (DUF2062 family)
LEKSEGTWEGTVDVSGLWTKELRGGVVAAVVVVVVVVVVVAAVLRYALGASFDRRDQLEKTRLEETRRD